MAQSSTSVQRTTGAERRVQALKLRQQGLTYREVGDRLGVSGERARAIIKDEMAELQEQSAELRLSLRDQSLRELQELHQQYLLLALAGDKGSLHCLLKIMDRESRFLGMDEPVKTQVLLPANPYENMALEELEEEAKRRGLNTTTRVDKIQDAEFQVLPQLLTVYGDSK